MSNRLINTLLCLNLLIYCPIVSLSPEYFYVMVNSFSLRDYVNFNKHENLPKYSPLYTGLIHSWVNPLNSLYHGDI